MRGWGGAGAGAGARCSLLLSALSLSQHIIVPHVAANKGHGLGACVRACVHLTNSPITSNYTQNKHCAHVSSVAPQ